MSLLRWRSAFPVRLRAFFRRSDTERELDDEFRDHIECQTAANRAAGMTPDASRRAALVAFGGIERVKDESRDVRGLTLADDIVRLRQAARALRRTPTYAVAVVATIAITVAAASTVFTVVRYVLLRPLPYPDANRLVSLYHALPGVGLSLVDQAPGTYVSYRDEARSFDGIGAYVDGHATVDDRDPTLPSERLHLCSATASLLTTLGVRPLAGRLFVGTDERGDAPRVALVSERWWRTRYHADRGVIGRTVRVDGLPLEIIGILPSEFAFPASDVDLWVPLAIPRIPYLGSFVYRAVARLRPGASIESAQRELQQILERTPNRYPEQRPGISTASALARSHAIVVVHALRDDAVAGFGRILWLVAATIAALMLVAFGNVASLVLARAEARQREYAVRRALGASRAHLWWSLAGESVLMSAVGGALGLAIGAVALVSLAGLGPSVLPDPAVTGAAPTLVPRLAEIHADTTFTACALTIAASFAILATAIGSWRLGAGDTGNLFQGGRTVSAGRRRQRVRTVLVAVQVALALVLLSGSAVLARSVVRVRAIAPGFEAGSTLTFRVTASPVNAPGVADVARFYRQVIDTLGALPGVETVAVVSRLPLSQGWFGASPVFVEDSPPAQGEVPGVFAVEAASARYFAAMRIPILAGRSFDEGAVRQGAREVIASRGFVARYWHDSTGQRAIGRRIRPASERGWYTIVGVAGDVRDTALTGAPTSAVYLPADVGADTLVGWPRGTREMAFVVRMRPGMWLERSVVSGAVQSVDPTVPLYDVASMLDRIGDATRRTDFVLTVLAAGAVATLCLGVVGLYGVIAYLVSLRRREIGIRIALGLAPVRAARMIFGHGAIIVAVGLIVGIGAFALVSRWLASLVFEIGVLDAPTLVVTVVTVGAVGLLATLLPARRAARVDPATVLNAE